VTSCYEFKSTSLITSIIFDTNQQFMFISDYNNNCIYKMDLNSGSLTNIHKCINPTHIVLTPCGNYLFVCANNRIEYINKT
jgi:DNA-binding beta-propeller fold protein YncE